MKNCYANVVVTGLVYDPEVGYLSDGMAEIVHYDSEDGSIIGFVEIPEGVVVFPTEE